MMVTTPERVLSTCGGSEPRRNCYSNFLLVCQRVMHILFRLRILWVHARPVSQAGSPLGKAYRLPVPLQHYVFWEPPLAGLRNGWENQLVR